MAKKIVSILALILVVALTAGASALAEQRILSDKVLRLHVIAASDSDADQQLKLLVRDAVLEVANGETPDLAAIERAARGVIEREGYSYPVNVELGREDYPTRNYDTFALPAGNYNSLRVIIGGGEGKNWWCVLFPPLCVSTAEEFEETARSAGLSDEEIALISKEDGAEVRFRVAEWFQAVASFFSGKGK